MRKPIFKAFMGLLCTALICGTHACARPAVRSGAPAIQSFPRPRLSSPVPEYPWLHAGARIGDNVTARFKLLPTGAVDSSSLVIEAAHFGQSTREAILQWTFAMPEGFEPKLDEFVYTVHLRFWERDTVGAAPGEQLSLERTRVQNQDSTGIWISPGLRIPTYGRSPIGGAEDLPEERSDSILMAVADWGLAYEVLVGARSSNEELCLDQLPTAVSSWIEERYPGARSDPDCTWAGHAHTSISMGPPEIYPDGWVRVWFGARSFSQSDPCPPGEMCFGRHGRTSGLDCYLRREEGAWKPLCMQSESVRAWVSDDLWFA